MAENKKKRKSSEDGAEGGATEKRRSAHTPKEQARREKAAAKAAEEARIERERRRKAEIKAEKRAIRREKRARAARVLKVIFLVLLIVLLLAGIGATVGGFLITKSDTILPNVYLDGVSVDKMTREQAMDALKAAGWEDRARTPLTVYLPAEQSFELDRVTSGAMLARGVAVEAAYRYGHGNNWYENLLRYGKSLFSPTDVLHDYAELDEDYIRENVEAAIAQFEELTADDSYEVDREAAELRLMKGGGQMQIDADLLCAEIEDALRSGQSELDHRHVDNELTPPDFEAIFTELHVKPVNAEFVEGGFEVIEETVGCTFDVEQALALWEAAAPAEAVVIPLDIQYPEVTAESLRGMLFRDKLGEQTTLFGGSTPERVNNIQLAVSKLNGVVIDPGETFSYNETVGERTKEAGFKLAAAYQDGEVVQELGGGVCQVSSTLYCAAFYANMETVEREGHYFMVNYLEWGHDATVSWPSPDFKFKNTRDYPVKIVATADADSMSLNIQIWGTDVDGSYVEMTYDRYYFTYEGSEDIAGFHVWTYRNIYDKEGNLIETRDESEAMYHKHEE